MPRIPKCKLHMVETRFSIVGAVTSFVAVFIKALLCVLENLLPKDLESLKMKYAPSITKDFAVLFKFLNKAKESRLM